MEIKLDIQTNTTIPVEQWEEGWDTISTLNEAINKNLISDDSIISGKINLPVCSKIEKKKVEDQFDIEIEVDENLQQFNDAEACKVIAANAGDGLPVSKEDFENITDIGTWFQGNQKITEFMEFANTNVTTTKYGVKYFDNSSIKKVDFSKITYLADNCFEGNNQIVFFGFPNITKSNVFTMLKTNAVYDIGPNLNRLNQLSSNTTGQTVIVRNITINQYAYGWGEAYIKVYFIYANRIKLKDCYYNYPNKTFAIGGEKWRTEMRALAVTYANEYAGWTDSQINGEWLDKRIRSPWIDYAIFGIPIPEPLNETPTQILRLLCQSRNFDDNTTPIVGAYDGNINSLGELIAETDSLICDPIYEVISGSDAFEIDSDNIAHIKSGVVDAPVTIRVKSESYPEASKDYTFNVTDYRQVGYMEFEDPEVEKILLKKAAHPCGDGIGLKYEDLSKITDINVWFINNDKIESFMELGSCGVTYMCGDNFKNCTNLKRIDVSNINNDNYIRDKASGSFIGVNRIDYLAFLKLPKYGNDNDISKYIDRTTFLALPVVTGIGGLYLRCEDVTRCVDIGKKLQKFYWITEKTHPGRDCCIIIRCETFPELGVNVNAERIVNFLSKFFVPESLLDTYKQNSVFSAIQSQIYAISGPEWEAEFGSTDPYANIDKYVTDPEEREKIKAAYREA